MATNFGEIARIFASRTVWSVTGLDAAGRTLVRALGSQNEDVRTIAGMFLVNAGKRAEPLLEEALREGRQVPMVIDVLGSIGDPQVIPDLRPLTQNPDPEIAQAAREAIRTIDFANR